MKASQSLEDFIFMTGTLQELKVRVRNLEAIEEWAIASLGLPYSVGDKVVINSVPTITDQSGWWRYRECLVAGSTATVKRIDFSSHTKMWMATIQLDKEWTVWKRGKETVRTWHGKASEIPPGFEQLSPIIIQAYPEGKFHTFVLNVYKLLKAPQGDSNGNN